MVLSLATAEPPGLDWLGSEPAGGASVGLEEELAFWDRTVPAQLTPAKLRVRTALANQAVTFQAGMPLGIVLADHMLIPEGIRKGL